MTPNERRTEECGPGYHRFFLYAVIAVAVAILPLLLWQLADVLLLGVGALLMATLVHVVAEPFHRWTPLPVWAALLISGLIIIGAFGATAWIFGSQITSEFFEVLHRVGAGLTQVQVRLATNEFGRVILEQAKGTSISVTAMLNRLFSLGTTFFEALVVIFISAIYLAAQPQLYRDGFVLLFPPHLHAETRETLDDIGRALRLWLLGQLIQMIIIGLLSAVAVWLIGLPSPLALGSIAMVAEFVPYLGPIAAAVPAVLVAITKTPADVLWTLLAYLLIHQIEGNIVSPLIQRRMIFIPPATMLLGIAAIGTLLGMAGIVFAAPIVVIALVFVKKLYVRYALGESTPLPGEQVAATPVRRD